MKRAFKGLAIALGVMAALLLGIAVAVKLMNPPLPPPVMGDIDVKGIADGMYAGSYDYGLVKVAVQVRVKEGRIKDIIIEKHDNGLGKKAEVITEAIIREQSLNVDVVAGATSSSNAIRKAVEVALSRPAVQ